MLIYILLVINCLDIILVKYYYNDCNRLIKMFCVKFCFEGNFI